MKTDAQIRQEINIIFKEVQRMGIINEKKRKQPSPRLEELKILKYYLDTNPSQGFIEREVKRLETRLETLDQRFATWSSESPKAKGLKNPRAAFDADFKVGKIKSQVRALKYLLN
jgi:hypothetical protein